MSKGLETLKEYEQEFVYADEYFDIIEKELKALEIIKPYCLVADYGCDNEEDRYELAFCKKVCISKEEYDLLKEVLK